MNLLHADAPTTLLIAGWVIVLAALLQSAWTVRHRFLPTPATQHGWLAAIVAVSLLWALHVRSPVGLDFGLLGSALFALVFGRARAVLGLMAAVALYTVMDDGSWRNIGVNGVVLAVAPAWIATALQRQIERRLPKNLFVFIIGNGLFVTLRRNRRHQRTDSGIVDRRGERPREHAGGPHRLFAAAGMGRGGHFGNAVLCASRVRRRVRC